MNFLPNKLLSIASRIGNVIDPKEERRQRTVMMPHRHDNKRESRIRILHQEKLILRGNLYVLSPNNKASGKPLSSFVSALKNEATNKPLSSLMGSIKDLSTGGKGPAVVVDLSSFVPEEFIMSLICTERKGAPTSYTMLIGDQHIKLSAKLTLSPDIETFKRYEHT
eukprot:gene28913-38237_t